MRDRLSARLGWGQVGDELAGWALLDCSELWVWVNSKLNDCLIL